MHASTARAWPDGVDIPNIRLDALPAELRAKVDAIIVRALWLREIRTWLIGADAQLEYDRLFAELQADLYAVAAQCQAYILQEAQNAISA